MPARRLTLGFATAVAIMLITGPVAQAQQRFSAGPRVGVNLSNYAGGNLEHRAITGVTAGVFLMYSSLNHFGLSADLLYSQKGASIRAPDSYKQRINYLEVPIALRYFLTRSGNFRPNLFVGPTVGFKLSATEIPTSTGLSRDISGDINALDLGVMAGFQLNVKGLGARQRFLIDGRYTYGLPEVFTRPEINSRNSVFTLTLGYGVGVGPTYRSIRRR